MYDMYPKPLSAGRIRESDNDSDSGSTSTSASADSEITGLGINFYDHRGVSRRSTCLSSIQAEHKGYEAIAVLRQQKRDSEGRTPVAKQRDSPVSIAASTCSVQTPRPIDYDPDLTRSPSVLIEKLLEQNYREQAETFVRIASRSTPVRALSGGSHSHSSPRSATALVPVNDALGIATVVLVETPSPVVAEPDTSSDVETSTSTSTSTYRLTNSVSFTRSFSVQTTHNTGTPRLTRSTSSSRSLSIPVSPRHRIQSATELIRSKQRHGTGTKSGSGFSPLATSELSQVTTGAFQIRIPIPSKPSKEPAIIKKGTRALKFTCNDLYFTSQERQAISKLVHATSRNCERHSNCTDCINLEYAYHENKALPLTMDPEQRQKIINNNRSLRNIKNELESLAEHGAISDEQYDAIMSALPEESSLGGSARSHANPTPTPAARAAPSPAPTNALNNLSLNNDPPPPAYNTPASPPAPPAKAEIVRATALYRYAEPNDCTFEPGDQIAVHEYMNNDWWLGKNLRTGKEGVFPKNYVQVSMQAPAPSPYGAYGNEKQGNYGGYPGQYQPQQQMPPAPGPGNPYNSSVPPMAVAEQPTGDPDKPNKGAEMGKKFGKKLGNAAIFGAGATIGGNIVNSIF